MKKVFLILLTIILLTGCNKEKVEITYDNTYYQVASPYKKGVSSYTLNSYDKNEVESMMMYLSTKYFNANNSFYEEGQYLSTDIIKDLLTKFNETDKLLDDSSTKTTYISTIYEQDYLANNNNLKGLSLSLVLNCNQKYVKDNVTYTQVLDEKEVLDFGKERANQLLDYIRSNEALKDVRVVIGLYVESSNYVKGSFKYIGDTSNNKISLDYINYNYKLLDSNEASNSDLNNYNIFNTLKTSLKDYNYYIKGLGFYKDNTLIKLDITISNNYLSQSQILNVSNIISNQLLNFDSEIKVKVYFNSNNKIKALLTKDGLEFKTYMMEG